MSLNKYVWKIRLPLCHGIFYTEPVFQARSLFLCTDLNGTEGENFVFLDETGWVGRGGAWVM